MSKDTRSRFMSEIKRLQPSVQKEFMRAIEDRRADINFRAVVEALERSDVDAALRALRTNVPFWARFGETLRNVLMAGGSYVETSIRKTHPVTGNRLVLRFDGRRPDVEDWLSEESGRLIQGLNDTELATARRVLSQGMEAGRNPRDVALDLVGRVSKVTGKRTGGSIGLTERDANAVAKYRAKLEDEGRAQDQIDRMVTRKQNKLLRARGERIARTETLKYLGRGRAAGYQQLIDSGQVPASAITHSWDASLDGRERFTHRLMNGQSKPFQEPFISASGDLLMRPGDTSLGAGADEVINCRCFERVKIDYTAEF